jgi:hypothetical protein
MFNLLVWYERKKLAFSEFRHEAVSLHRMRGAIKTERQQSGRCKSCGQPVECEAWCWGPKAWQFITVFVNAKPWPLHTAAISFWRIYRNELRWAGVEPWHRY